MIVWSHPPLKEINFAYLDPSIIASPFKIRALEIECQNNTSLRQKKKKKNLQHKNNFLIKSLTQFQFD